jgi:tetratricopeptide (TPR) repeat protein
VRGIAVTLQIDIDIGAPPIATERLRLLALGPDNLAKVKNLATSGALTGGTPIYVRPSGNPEADDLINAAVADLATRRIAEADVDWAFSVDQIAAEGDALANQGELLSAIEKYRAALRLAPGCDTYLMSIGNILAHLEMLDDALRYLERAAHINPGSQRIARNLAMLRDYANST